MDRPILFSAAMVKALLAGTKTQTRRIVKPQPSAGVRLSPFVQSGIEDGHGRALRIPYCVGDRLWVREAHTRFDKGSCDAHVWYAAGGNDPRDFPAKIAGVTEGAWPLPEGPAGGAPYRVSPIFLPRWASRLTLLVTDVRVERLQAISEEDARAEGCGLTDEQVAKNDELRQRPPSDDGREWAQATAGGNFLRLWCEIHGGIDAWDANPWVAALTFRPIRANIDAPEAQEQAA